MHRFYIDPAAPQNQSHSSRPVAAVRFAVRVRARFDAVMERIHLGPNPLLGVFFHWLGGLASGSFYVPFRRVKVLAWETYWLVGGFFSWIIVPWILALCMTGGLIRVRREAPAP